MELLTSEVQIGNVKLTVEIADSQEERERGLSERASLDDDKGMLFIFKNPGRYGFWMKDMSFPIDIIWIDESWKIVDIKTNVSPATYPKSFFSVRSAKYVLETNAGFVNKNNIKLGDYTVSRMSTLSLSSTPLLTRFSDSDESIQIQGVPFTPQAPSGKWSDLRFQDGCEEASVTMAMRWIREEGITLKEAEEEIIKISQYELENYSTFRDTSPRDTLDRIVKGYFKYDNAEVVEDISLIDIKNELKKGHLVLVQVNGLILKNPNYTPPGPERHMLVITGYDAARQEFVANDPGTKKGEGYRYGEFKLWQSIRDYPTGDHIPISGENQKSMLIVRK